MHPYKSRIASKAWTHRHEITIAHSHNIAICLRMDVSGLESGVCLATLCYRIPVELHNARQRRRAIDSLREDITSQKDELKDELPQMSSKLRLAAEKYIARLERILTKIDHSRRRKMYPLFGVSKEIAINFYHEFDLA